MNMVHIYLALPGGPAFNTLCGDRDEGEMCDPNDPHEHCTECGLLHVIQGKPRLTCPGESCSYQTDEDDHA
jgi:hypothetical protein